MQQQEWNEYYENHDESWAEPDPFLLAEVAELPAGRALDLGAGEGVNSIWLAEHGWQVTAVDFAQAAVAKIEGVARERDLAIHAEVGDILTYRADGNYDLVAICYIHLPPEERAMLLANAASALAPDGTLLFIGFPNADSFGGEDDMDDLFASGDALIALLPPGLIVERNDTTRHIFPWQNESFEADVVVVKAWRPAG